MKSIARFLSFSLLLQVFSAFCGLLLTRWLTVEDYAIYTVVTIMMGAIYVLTQGGTQLALSAELGQVWPDTLKSAHALKAALILRKYLAFIVLPIILLLSLWLLQRNGATQLTSFLMLLVLSGSFLVDFKSRLFDRIIYFNQQAHLLEAWSAILALVRLICLFVLYQLEVLGLLSALLVGLIVAAIKIFPIQALVAKAVPRWYEVTPPVAVSGRMRPIVYRQFPLDMFMVLQSQIVLVLLALMGGADNTAAMGALTRIGQLFVPVTSLLGAIAVPRFARASHQQFMPVLMLWVGVSILPGILLCVSALIIPELLLFLVGDNYSGLQTELLVVCGYYSVNAVVSCFCLLLANRGLNKRSYIQVPIYLLWCLVSPLVLDLTTLSGVLLFQLGFPIALGVAAIFELLHWLKQPKPEQ